MPGWQRTYITACSAVIGFVLAYVLCDYSRWPRLAYFPYEREWGVVTTPPDPVTLLYVGTIAWGMGGALCCGVLAYLACTLMRNPVPERRLYLLGAWALAGFVYAGLYYTWSLWPF